MLKSSLLVAALAFSSCACAYDQADRDARLGRLVDQPGRVVALPGQAALIQFAPQVIYAPAPAPSPVECEQPLVDEPPTIYVLPQQSASLRTSR